jgi:hypothetical protein
VSKVPFGVWLALPEVGVQFEYLIQIFLNADEFQLEIRFVFASQNHLNNHLF